MSHKPHIIQKPKPTKRIRGTKRVAFNLTFGQIKHLKTLSETSGLTVAELIRRAIDGYLEKTL